MGADILVGSNPAYHQAGGGRNDERRNLGDKTIADGKQSVVPGSGGEVQIVLKHADDQAADHIDEKNQDSRNGIAPHELAGTIHGPVELRFLRNRGAPLARLLFPDQARR